MYPHSYHDQLFQLLFEEPSIIFVSFFISLKNFLCTPCSANLKSMNSILLSLKLYLPFEDYFFWIQSSIFSRFIEA